MTTGISDVVAVAISKDLGSVVKPIAVDAIAMSVTSAVSEYLREIIAVRGIRYRDMTDDQRYFLALHVGCPECEADPGERCGMLKRNKATDKAAPHFERLREGYRATHIYQLIGIGYPEDWHEARSASGQEHEHDD